ncbi:MAG: adenosine deaminase [Gemmatimonadota bacterium]
MISLLMLTREVIARLPKAELHNHLDGSLRPGTLIDLARESRVALPSEDPETIRAFMLVRDARHLEDYLRRFDITVGVLQTEEALTRVAYEMVADAAGDGIRYLEIRYCPYLSTGGGLSLSQVLDAELEGVRRGEREFGVRTGVINCSLRHFDPDLSLAIARISVEYRDRGVVGFDLAGGEFGRPPGAHAEAFHVAARGLLGTTVHAGEAAGSESIADALFRCHADRIGHGTRLYEDPGLVNYMRDHRVPIEINISSNVQTRAVPSAAAHPVREYFDAGLAVTLSTDSWLMAGTSLTDEYWLAHTALGFDRKSIDQMILHGFEAAFLSWPEKQRLLAEVKDELGSVI